WLSPSVRPSRRGPPASPRHEPTPRRRSPPPSTNGSTRARNTKPRWRGELPQIDHSGGAVIGAEGEQRAILMPRERRDRTVAGLAGENLGAVVDPHQQHQPIFV